MQGSEELLRQSDSVASAAAGYPRPTEPDRCWDPSKESIDELLRTVDGRSFDTSLRVSTLCDSAIKVAEET